MKIKIYVFMSLILSANLMFAKNDNIIFPGADETTPSRSMYFSWINHAWEGATEEQTIANLNFFKWLHNEYGMHLDIYLLDAGTIDGSALHWQKGIAPDQSAYGSLEDDGFKRRFPNGLLPMVQLAKSFGCKLGMWLGPDGFGENDKSALKRKEMLVSFCRDYDMDLFKFDLCCSNLRPEKAKWFIETMAECRKFNPDLIALNHRISLNNQVNEHTTTFLWEGQETYIDILIANEETAPHHRAKPMRRGLPPNLSRLTEDHGVCFSSHLDYWEDELVIQSFNRNLILAPEIYGNPWFLKDSEFSKLARIFNLHRKYRDILPQAVLLPENQYGPDCISRGDENTRLITFKNFNWNPVQYKIDLDEKLGLSKSDEVFIRQYAPIEKYIGQFKFGESVTIEVLPFRSALFKVCSHQDDEVVVRGVDYEVIKNIPNQPVKIKLLAFPGEQKSIQLDLKERNFKSATINSENVSKLLNNKSIKIKFDGSKLKKPSHRKLASFIKIDVPNDVRGLYEATCYTGSNNAYEVGCIERSGPSDIPQVQEARNAYFNHFAVKEKGIWDKYLFDDNLFTYFSYPLKDKAIKGGTLRIDFGDVIDFDKMTIEKISSEYDPEWVEVSADLNHWKRIKVSRRRSSLLIENDLKLKARYVQIQGCPIYVAEVNTYYQNTLLDKSTYKATNLFAPFYKVNVSKTWRTQFKIDEMTKNSYLALAIDGEHGEEGVIAALKINGKYHGAFDRAPGFKSVHVESPTQAVNKNYTYYFKVTPDMVDKKIEVFVLSLNDKYDDLESGIWITAYPIPYEEKMLILK